MYDIDALDREPSILEEPSSVRPSADLLRRVDELWKAEQARRDGTLRDGKIFSWTRRDEAGFRGHLVHYRWWIAQYREPDLFPGLRVRPLAVSGLLRVPEGLVFGRRSAHTTEHPGLWELVPSGGIDGTARGREGGIRAEAQLIAELGQELNAPAGSVRSTRPLALLSDSRTKVTDIAYEIELDLPYADLGERFAGQSNDEYGELRLVQPERLGAFLEEHSQDVAPISVAILEIAGYPIDYRVGDGNPRQ